MELSIINGNKALAAGNCVVLKPAEQTPASIMLLMELIGDLLPAGVVNVVSGYGLEAGKPLASSKRIKKIAFTGETTTGRLIIFNSNHFRKVENHQTFSLKMFWLKMTTSLTNV